MPTSSPDNPPGSSSPQTTPAIGRELGGDLPCFACGYNLRGLSVRSMCPECGSAVRATILAVVDPQASELQPITYPRLVATGIILWASGAAAAGLLCWLPHLGDLLASFGLRLASRADVTLGVLIAIAISGLGSTALVRPHARMPPIYTILAALGTLLYAPLLWAEWKYQMLSTGPFGPRYLSSWTPTPGATRYFVLAAALIGTIIICTRPAARMLVARSLLMRTGRVDRQTMLAMASAAGMLVAGGLFGRATTTSPEMFAEASRIVGITLIAFGSLLLTIGLIGSLGDCLRITQAILAPRRTARQVIREGAPQPKTRIGRILDPNLPSAPPERSS